MSAFDQRPRKPTNFQNGTIGGLFGAAAGADPMKGTWNASGPLFDQDQGQAGPAGPNWNPGITGGMHPDPGSVIPTPSMPQIHPNMPTGPIYPGTPQPLPPVPMGGAPQNNPNAAPEMGYWGSDPNAHTMQYTPAQATFDRYFQNYWAPDRAQVLASLRAGGQSKDQTIGGNPQMPSQGLTIGSLYGGGGMLSHVLAAMHGGQPANLAAPTTTAGQFYGSMMPGMGGLAAQVPRSAGSAAGGLMSLLKGIF